MRAARKSLTEVVEKFTNQSYQKVPHLLTLPLLVVGVLNPDFLLLPNPRAGHPRRTNTRGKVKRVGQILMACLVKIRKLNRG